VTAAAVTRPLSTRLLIVLGALSAFGPLSMDLYLPALPQVRADLGSTETLAQLTLSACMVGLALGQLVLGPVSDRYGRRTPLLIGVAAYAMTSLACAFAGDIGLLIVLRLLQGLAGGAGIVIARAVVRDRCDTAAAARVFSLLMLVTGAAPVLAPVLGGQLLRFTHWEGTFVALAVVGCALLLAALRAVPESLPPRLRTRAGIGESRRQLAMVLQDRRFVSFAAVLALGSAMLFSYIVMSPFVLQGEYGLSAQSFSLIFAANSVGLILAGSLSARLVRLLGPATTLTLGLTAGLTSATALAASAALGMSLAVLLPLLFITVSTVSLIMPASTALALAAHQSRAGAASGLLGLAQFGLGGVIGPLVSAGGVTAVLMTASMAGAVLAAFVVRLAVAFASRPKRAAPEGTGPLTTDA
jgi:DHA1 family bicyclomycin/chloramphenicol resistance-like MFS transporter